MGIQAVSIEGAKIKIFAPFMLTAKIPMGLSHLACCAGRPKDILAAFQGSGVFMPDIMAMTV